MGVFCWREREPARFFVHPDKNVIPANLQNIRHFARPRIERIQTATRRCAVKTH